MKQIILFLVALPFAISAQWNLIYNHADQENAIAVLDKDTIIAVTNSGGRFHRSTDGGNNWTFYQSPFTQTWFTDVHFPEKSIGYACGGSAFGMHKNVIVKTINAGITWDSVTANHYPGYSFNKIHFISADTGFVSGDGPGLLKTENGGGTFTPVSFPNGGIANAIHFVTSQIGLVGVSKYITTTKYVYSILRTTDQGASWNAVWIDTVNLITAANSRAINEFYFVSNAVGYAVGGSGLFLRTNDGGLTWTSTQLSPANELQTIFFTSPTTAYTNLAGGISQTLDGGLNWNAQLVSSPTTFGQIRFANDSIGFAVGAAGIYRSRQSNPFTTIEQFDKNYAPLIYPNPCSDIIYFNSKDLNEEKIIFSAEGKEVFRFKGRSADVKHLTPGFYTIRSTAGSNAQLVIR